MKKDDIKIYPLAEVGAKPAIDRNPPDKADDRIYRWVGNEKR